jgi:hypothetical protein
MKKIPSLKNTSSNVVINFKDWEKQLIENLILFLQIADLSSDEYDFDPNDDKVLKACLKKIVDTIRSCLVNEWKLINNSQNRNDGCIKISEKQYNAIYSNLINSIISETAELKNSNEKYVVPYLDFFVNTIKDYFGYWWNDFRHLCEQVAHLTKV